jgi:basic amino acid/polyamine antiporter, APA family
MTGSNRPSPPQLRTFSLTMIVIGLVIGLGIFRTAKDVAGAALTPGIYFTAWIAGGIIAICGGLVFAEIGSRYPVTGGYYAIFSYAYHPSVAFAINCVILVSNAASLSGVALIGSEYLLELFRPGYGSSPLLASLAILIFYLVNFAGLNFSSKTQNFLMIIKIMVLVLIIGAIFFIPGNPNAKATEAIPGVSWVAILISFGAALKAVSFSYGGYQQTINFGGEVHDVKRTVPRSIIAGMVGVIILYLLVNLAYYRIIGFEELKQTNAIASTVAGRLFGKGGAWTSGIIMFIAVLAYVNVSLLSNPRVMVAMSRDGILPSAFQRRHEPTGVFRVSLTVFAGICVFVLFFTDTFNEILSFVIFLDSIGMVTAGIALFVFRKRQAAADASTAYKIGLYPLVPLIFIFGYFFVAAVITLQFPLYALSGTAALAFFFILYFLMYGKLFRK